MDSLEQVVVTTVVVADQCSTVQYKLDLHSGVHDAKHTPFAAPLNGLSGCPHHVRGGFAAWIPLEPVAAVGVTDQCSAERYSTVQYRTVQAGAAQWGA
jgi:hypothetical protein